MAPDNAQVISIDDLGRMARTRVVQGDDSWGRGGRDDEPE